MDLYAEIKKCCHISTYRLIHYEETCSQAGLNSLSNSGLRWRWFHLKVSQYWLPTTRTSTRPTCRSISTRMVILLATLCADNKWVHYTNKYLYRQSLLVNGITWLAQATKIKNNYHYILIVKLRQEITHLCRLLLSKMHLSRQHSQVILLISCRL